MKKIFKKNQIIITALAVMIAAAGYISYSDAQLKGKKDKTAKTETSVRRKLRSIWIRFCRIWKIWILMLRMRPVRRLPAMVQMPRLPVKNHPAQNHSPRRHRGRLF